MVLTRARRRPVRAESTKAAFQDRTLSNERVRRDRFILLGLPACHAHGEGTTTLPTGNNTPEKTSATREAAVLTRDVRQGFVLTER